ncbi:MAG: hypothetical protein ACR2QQ_05650 [Gammaproteobacteria bacterium]
MRTKALGVLVALLTVTSATKVLAQLEVGGDLLDNCADIDALQNAGNFTEARDKARLCLEGLEQQLVGEVGLLFLDQIGDWTRTSFEQNQVMGFNNITATYEKDNITVDVSLTGQAGGGGGALGGLGGIFGGLAQSAILQGGQQVTVAGLPSSLTPDGVLNVPLEDGSILSFMSSDLDTADAALAGMGDLVNDFPVADVNAALQ